MATSVKNFLNNYSNAEEYEIYSFEPTPEFVKFYKSFTKLWDS